MKNEEKNTTILSRNPIVKLVYKHEFFDVSEMKNGARIITTITDDGNVVVKEYKADSRKVCSTKKITCSASDVRQLCEKLESCIESANRCDAYCDDCDDELKIFYKYNRIQIVDRGLGNNDTDIGTIMSGFLSKL